MESRLRVQGHPIQPMLVTVPFGLFVCATVFDLTDLLGGPGILGEVGYWTVVAALVSAALAVAAGMVDLWDVPADRTRRTVVMFNLANAVMAVLFVFVCLARAGGPDRGASGGLLAVELLGLAIGAVGVRLGAVLVQRFDRHPGEAPTFDALGSAAGVGVEGPAHPTRS
ncbi:hypothetical protein GCM10027280_48510 [Micromonospora polyrhachis]|uniref:Putative membrane protein n=1 Tax=Micromonospora polyrhachis TaxID=1282883 RepID=A0A7W7SWG7_9ACTN|nr:DUF2231 domain-containing protein [Micromonospora polyrhachis]MBB4962229.1 putative membrane protein [Micromonospora polyrhachis]